MQIIDTAIVCTARLGAAVWTEWGLCNRHTKVSLLK
jgi:hypothetical protein